jgi:uncharacterized protein (TIGR02996 family)
MRLCEAAMHDDVAFLLQLDQDADDATTLLVYADWLDEQGDDGRAAFLRLQQRVLTLRHRQTGFSDLSKQLSRLGRALDPAWLAVVSRPRLAGTCWVGDSNVGLYIWRYLPGGVLNYTSPSGTFQNGTWSQVGNRVAMETNRHYADYTGFVGGHEVRGTASNVAGLKWRLRLRRTTDPKHCKTGKPCMRVFGGHANDPTIPGRRRRRRSPGR